MNKKLLIILGFIICCISIGLWWWRSPVREGLAPYNPTRDKEFIKKLFNDNWYWLIPDNGTFSVDQFLAQYRPGTKALSEDSNDILVYLVDGKPIGMLAYHMESFYKGRLRFIVIDTKYRGKGYSQKMLDHAVSELKKLGAAVIVLMTRVNNEPALKLYEKNDFCSYWQNDKYIMMEKDLTGKTVCKTSPTLAYAS